MNAKKLLAAVAVFAAAGSAFAQQTEFVAPDAGFHSSMTRAEVRQDLARAQAQGFTAQREHDGQDTIYAGSGKTREEVKAEAAAHSKEIHSRQVVENIYFG
jgi:hypothetical protein